MTRQNSSNVAMKVGRRLSLGRSLLPCLFSLSRSKFTMNEEEIQIEEADLLNNLPFHVLEMIIMRFCGYVEYLHFRATCKRCRLAAPVVGWRTNGRRLQTISPWLMVFDKDARIMTFTDPVFGDKYFIKVMSPYLFYGCRILCSRYGWLLVSITNIHLAFFNPFTGDIRKLPELPAPRLDCFCFSAPPSSPNSIVVGFLTSDVVRVYIHFVSRQPGYWHLMDLNFSTYNPHPVRFPAFCGRDVFALFDERSVRDFKEIVGDGNICWERVIEAAPKSVHKGLKEYFQVKCDKHDLLLVIVRRFGESVEVWKLNEESVWEIMNDLGRHVIYICGATCVCMDAKTPEMENKIYFPRFYPGSAKILFYSMKTRMCHTFDGRTVGKSFKNFFCTNRYFYPHAWIEPSWC